MVLLKPHFEHSFARMSSMLNSNFQVVDPEPVFMQYTCDCGHTLTRSCYCPLFEAFSVKCANVGLFDASIIPEYCKGSSDRTTKSPAASTQVKPKPATSLQPTFPTTSMKAEEKTESGTKQTSPVSPDTKSMNTATTPEIATVTPGGTGSSEDSKSGVSDSGVQTEGATVTKPSVLSTNLSPEVSILFWLTSLSTSGFDDLTFKLLAGTADLELTYR